MFYDTGCVTRHFDAHHLYEDPLKCNYCEVFLVHKMAFQRHASDIHRVESESFARGSQRLINHFAKTLCSFHSLY